MVRKTHLTPHEVQQYTLMATDELAKFIAQVGTSKAAHLFSECLRSFRIAAHAANAAWKLFDLYTSGIKHNRAEVVTPTAWDELKEALAVYAPDSIPASRATREYSYRVLEETYNYLSYYEKEPGHVVLDQLFQRIEAMRQQS